MKKALLIAVALLLSGASLPVMAQSPASCPTSLTACKYNDITTNTTTTVKSGPGYLHTVTINTKGATANVLTIYDNTAGSGTKIATLDTTGGSQTFEFDVGFATGLTIVTATGTAADVTVSYI